MLEITFSSTKLRWFIHFFPYTLSVTKSPMHRAATVCQNLQPFLWPTSLSLFPFPPPIQFLSTSVCYDRPTFLGSLGRVPPQQLLQARLCPLCAVLQQSPARGLCRPASLHRPSCWQHSRGTELSFAKRPKTSLAVVASSPVCYVAPADFEE